MTYEGNIPTFKGRTLSSKLEARKEIEGSFWIEATDATSRGRERRFEIAWFLTGA
jgi:hypothetical protein